jgi:hypothetical protein
LSAGSIASSLHSGGECGEATFSQQLEFEEIFGVDLYEMAGGDARWRWKVLQASIPRVLLRRHQLSFEKVVPGPLDKSRV